MITPPTKDHEMEIHRSSSPKHPTSNLNLMVLEENFAQADKAQSLEPLHTNDNILTLIDSAHLPPKEYELLQALSFPGIIHLFNSPDILPLVINDIYAEDQQPLSMQKYLSKWTNEQKGQSPNLIQLITNNLSIAKNIANHTLQANITDSPLSNLDITALLKEPTSLTYQEVVNSLPKTNNLDKNILLQRASHADSSSSKKHMNDHDRSHRFPYSPHENLQFNILTQILSHETNTSNKDYEKNIRLLIKQFSENIARPEDQEVLVKKLTPAAHLLTFAAISATYDLELNENNPFDPSQYDASNPPPPPEIPSWLAERTKELLKPGESKKLEMITSHLRRITLGYLEGASPELTTLDIDDIDALLEVSQDPNADNQLMHSTIMAIYHKLDLTSGNKKTVAANIATINAESLSDIWRNIHTQIRQRLIEKYQREQLALEKRAQQKAEQDKIDKEKPPLEQRSIAENIMLLALTYPNAPDTIPTNQYKSLFSLLEKYYPEEKINLTRQTKYSKQQQFNLTLDLLSSCIKDPGVKLSDDEESLLNSLSDLISHNFGEAAIKPKNSSMLQSRDQYTSIIHGNPDFLVNKILSDHSQPLSTDSLEFQLLSSIPNPKDLPLPEDLPSPEDMEQIRQITTTPFMEAILINMHDAPKFINILKKAFSKKGLYPEKLKRAYKEAFNPKRLKPIKNEPDKPIPPLEKIAPLIIIQAFSPQYKDYPATLERLARDLANSYFEPQEKQKSST